jgi:type VI protein secretion system component VasK
MTSIIGPKSKKLLKEIGRLETARNRAAEEEARLTHEVADRQGKLNVARGRGLIGQANRDQVSAFESELEKLQGELVKARSSLDGLDQILANRHQDLEKAKIADVAEALTTEQMCAALEGLEANAKSLEETRGAILKTLKSGAKRLLEKLADQRQEWQHLVEERKELYRQRYRALGSKAIFSDSDYYKLLRDDHVKLFPDVEDLGEVVELARLLQPLLDQGQRK